MVNTCVALLVVTLVVARPLALPLLGALVVLLVLGYRVYIRLARGYTRLQLLYQFVGSTGHTSELEDVVSSILSEAAGLLHATTAQLVTLPLRPGAGAVRHLAGAGRCSTEPVGRDRHRRLVGTALAGESVLLRHDANGRPGRHECGRPPGRCRGGRCARRATWRRSCWSPDRTFEEETFGQEDLRSSRPSQRTPPWRWTRRGSWTGCDASPTNGRTTRCTTR